jgi:hypothetical protein
MALPAPRADLCDVHPKRQEHHMGKRQFTAEEARAIGDRLDIDWGVIPLDEFRMGLAVELEHGARDPATDVTQDDTLVTGKIALAHLNEFPDYYTRLEKMEAEASAFWSTRV